MIGSFFPGVGGPLVSEVANHLWQSTLFALLAGVLALALKNNRARIRYWLWFTASVKFLFPFTLLIALSSHLMWVRPVSPKPAAIAHPETYLVMEEVSQPFALADVTAMPAAPAPGRMDLVKTPPVGSFLPVALMATWLAGALLVVARWARRWWKISTVVRKARALTDGREVDALRRIERLAGARRPIALKLLPVSVEPGIFGIVHPVLLWPEGISSRLSDAQMEGILAHEVCHVRRGDNITAIVHMAVEAIFWFHPLVWWLEVRLVEARESACDESVLEFRVQARAYAESILKVCEFCVESPLPCVAGVSGADLRRRVADIVGARALLRMTWPKKLMLGSAALCVLAVPVMLGQAKAAQRMMLAVMGAAPRQLQTAAHFMTMQGQTATKADSAADGVNGATPDPAFAPVTIRLANPKSQGQQLQILPSGRMQLSSMPLQSLIMIAYSDPQQRELVNGGPKWAESDLFDIDVQLDKANMAGWDKLTFAEQIERMRPLMQTLLEQRFKLKQHAAMISTPVYALEQTKGGSKLKEVPAPTPDELKTAAEAAPNSQPTGTPRVGINVSNTGWVGHAVTIPFLTGWVGYALGLQDKLVIDQTGLTGYYDLTLSLIKQDGGPTPEQQFEEQTGLRLDSRNVPIKTLVIDSVEKPAMDAAGVPAPMPVVEQAPPPPHIHFDVVSWKRCKDDAIKGSGRVDMPLDSDFVAYHCQPIRRIIYFAFTGPMPFELSGHPSWVDSDLYEFQAKVAPEDIAAWKAMTLDNKRIAVRGILADQLKLQIHVDKTPQPAYALTVAKGGPKLTPYKVGEQWKIADGRILQGREQAFLGGTVYLQNFTMSNLASNLSARLDRPVVDQTGLDDSYDVTLPLAKGTSGASPFVGNGDDQPSLDSGLMQLGLKLVETKTEADGLVVDHIERPQEN